MPVKCWLAWTNLFNLICLINKTMRTTLKARLKNDIEYAIFWNSLDLISRLRELRKYNKDNKRIIKGQS